MTIENDRLRRELRAMASVNHQLLAMQEEPGGARKTRRASAGAGWIEELATRGECTSRLVRGSDGSVFVVEGDRKRAVRSGILAAALEPVLGAPEELSGAMLQALDDGVPVELLEAATGLPFVIAGGKRHDVTGIPLPVPVEDLQASEFPEGEPMNAAAANVSRRRFEEALSGQFQLARARGAVAQKGALGTAKALGRRVSSATKRALGR